VQFPFPEQTFGELDGMFEQIFKLQSLPVYPELHEQESFAIHNPRLLHAPSVAFFPKQVVLERLMCSILMDFTNFVSQSKISFSFAYCISSSSLGKERILALVHSCKT
jgi:hypothetical protein